MYKFAESVDYETWIMRCLDGLLGVLFMIGMTVLGVKSRKKKRRKVNITKRAHRVAEEFMTTRL